MPPPAEEVGLAKRSAAFADEDELVRERNRAPRRAEPLKPIDHHLRDVNLPLRRGRLRFSSNEADAVHSAETVLNRSEIDPSKAHARVPEIFG